MRLQLKNLAAWALVVSMATPAAFAQGATTTTTTTKTTTTHKKVATAKRKPASSPLADEIRQLRESIAAQQQQMQQQQQQIQALQQQVQQASQQSTEVATRAQAAAEQAQTKAAAAESALTESNTNFSKLQGDVADVKLNQQNAAVSTQQDQTRIGAVEGLVNRFRFTGDVRVRGEAFHQKYAGCVACFDRNRARIRVRFGVEGKINEDFTGGFALATGAWAAGAPDFKDPVSTNETLTGFFERKTIGLDRGWVTYNPQAHKWLTLTGGKFAYSWSRTPLTFDNDLNPEGFSEKVAWNINNPVFKNVSFQGMQLFYNEVAAGVDANAVGGSFATKLQLGKWITVTPTYNILNWNQADTIAQAASPVTLAAPAVTPTRIINANAFTNASKIVGVGANQKRAFVSGFMYSDAILDTNVKTPWERYPWRILLEYEDNLRAVGSQGQASWLETSFGQQKNRNDLLFGYSFARIEQDSLISQFNESDMRAPTNVAQHRFYFNWLLQKNTTVAFTSWVGRTLNANLQNAAKAPGLPAGAQDPWLNRLQLDLIYKF